MNVFSAVKQSVTTRQAADAYGIKVNRRGMAVCPFHNDKNPSMKVDNRFHCFGCQADGDVIDFVSALFNLSNVNAALKLAQDFGVSYQYERGGAKTQSRPVSKKARLKLSQYKEDEKQRMFVDLTNYLHLLNHWIKKYAPKTMDEEWHPLFDEALGERSYVEYLADELLKSDIYNEKELLESCRKETAKIEKRYKEYVSGREAAVCQEAESSGASRAKSA